MGKIPWSKILTVGGSFVLGAALGIGGMMLAGPGVGTTFAPQGLVQAGILNNNAEGDQNPPATVDGPGERDDQTLNELGERTLADPALSNTLDPNASEPSDSDAPSLINLTAAEQEKLFSDYKQALGTLFDAWRSTDIASFETKISEAYTVTLLGKR